MSHSHVVVIKIHKMFLTDILKNLKNASVCMYSEMFQALVKYTKQGKTVKAA